MLISCNTEIQTDNKEKIKLSFLASVSIGQGMGKFYGGAYYRALNDIKKNSSILPNHTIETMFEDTANDYLKALYKMTHLYVNETVGFIGPEGTCSHAAIVAAAWNLPFIGYVSIFFFLIFIGLYSIIYNIYIMFCFFGIHGSKSGIYIFSLQFKY